MRYGFCIYSFYIGLLLIAAGFSSCKQTTSADDHSDPPSVRQGQRIADSILSLRQDRQILALLKWYNSLLKEDSLQAVTELNGAERVFKEKDNGILRRQAWMLQSLYKAEKMGYNTGSAMLMLQAADEASSRGWPITQAECWHFAGHIYFKADLFVPAFEFMRKAQNVFDKRAQGEYIYL